MAKLSPEASKSYSLEFESNCTGLEFEAAARRMRQMLINLLSNAVKFTPVGGEVRLRATVDPPAGRIQFAVSDSGAGIAAEDLNKLFEPFVQLNPGTIHRPEGTGLALVKRLALQHGGDMTVTSPRAGQGSCFTITLLYVVPAAPEKPAEVPAAQAVAGPLAKAASDGGPLILVADDNDVNVQVTQDYLEQRGYPVVVAHDGAEALERAAEQDFAVFLMDVQMPGIDGIKVTRRLRRDPI